MLKQVEKENKAASMELLLRLVVRDEKGKVIKDTGNMQSRSFVENFLEFVSGMFDAVDRYMPDINNSSQRIYKQDEAANLYLRVDGGIGDSKGIVVGSSTTAPTNTDYKLATRILHGSGAGQLAHDSVSLDAVAVVGTNVDLVVKRAFTNSSGATITVKEVGMYCYSYSASYIHMLIRDVLVSFVDIPDKCSLTVYYTLRTTV